MKRLMTMVPILIGSGLGIVHQGADVTGTLTPVGTPLHPPARTEAGPACIVDLVQRYEVSGALAGRMEIDYRILVHGLCGSPAGTYDEEWIAHGTFVGVLQGDSASASFAYTAQVRGSGEVSGKMMFGGGLKGELVISGNFSDGSLSYSGSVARAEGAPGT